MATKSELNRDLVATFKQRRDVIERMQRYISTDHPEAAGRLAAESGKLLNKILKIQEQLRRKLTFREA
jgi:hypothetical protein